MLFPLFFDMWMESSKLFLFPLYIIQSILWKFPMGIRKHSHFITSRPTGDKEINC